jgi:hypothetical protein
LTRNYTKLELSELDDLIRRFQEDLQRIKVLQMLGQQLELLVYRGRADIHSLLLSLREDNLVSEEEHRELKERYALDEVGRKICRLYFCILTSTVGYTAKRSIGCRG